MSVSLKVEPRALRPRSLRNDLRREGKVPAILYGYEVENTPVAVSEAEIAKIVRQHGVNVVLSFELDGKKVNALISEPQFNTFNRKWEHLELISVNMTEEIEVETDIQVIGEETIMKAGKELAQALYTIRVSATPDKLPEAVTVDISNMEIGEAVFVKDIKHSDDFKIVTDPEEHVLTVLEKLAAPEEDEDAEATEAAPEA